MALHKHHILPKFAGGTDDLNNIIKVTQEQHYLLHYNRWLRYRLYGDLLACQLLQKNHLNLTTEEKRLIASKGDRAAQRTLKRKQISAFYDPKLRYDISSKGGLNGFFSKAYAKRNNISEVERIKLQSERGKLGGPKNKGFIWYNDGKTSYKYTKKRQQEKNINIFLRENRQYKMGRILPEPVKCPHCDKIGIKCAMVLHHFDKCKDKK